MRSLHPSNGTHVERKHVCWSDLMFNVPTCWRCFSLLLKLVLVRTLVSSLRHYNYNLLC